MNESLTDSVDGLGREAHIILDHLFELYGRVEILETAIFALAERVDQLEALDR